MDKKIAIIAAVLLGGAACVYAVTEMDGEELSATDPGVDVDDDSADMPDDLPPPIGRDMGIRDPQRPPEPEGALDLTLERLLDEGVLARGPSCGSNLCDSTEFCCVLTSECVDRDSAMDCRGPEGEMIDPPALRE